MTAQSDCIPTGAYETRLEKALHLLDRATVVADTAREKRDDIEASRIAIKAALCPGKGVTLASAIVGWRTVTDADLRDARSKQSQASRDCEKARALKYAAAAEVEAAKQAEADEADAAATWQNVSAEADADHEINLERQCKIATAAADLTLAVGRPVSVATEDVGDAIDVIWFWPTDAEDDDAQAVVGIIPHMSQFHILDADRKVVGQAVDMAEALQVVERRLKVPVVAEAVTDAVPAVVLIDTAPPAAPEVSKAEKMTVLALAEITGKDLPPLIKRVVSAELVKATFPRKVVAVVEMFDGVHDTVDVHERVRLISVKGFYSYWTRWLEGGACAVKGGQWVRSRTASVTLIQDDRQIDLEDAIARAGVTTADILDAETAAVVAFNAAGAALDARMASLIGMATDSPYAAHVPDSARDKAKADCPEAWAAFYDAARAVAGVADTADTKAPSAAAQMVTDAFTASNPKGVPLPFINILSAKFTKATFPRVVVAEVEMFDGLKSIAEVGEVDWGCRAVGMYRGAYIDEQVVGFSTCWKKIEGGACAVRNGQWVRVPSLGDAEAAPAKPKTASGYDWAAYQVEAEAPLIASMQPYVAPVPVTATVPPSAPAEIQGLPVVATIADVQRICGGTRLIAGITGYCRYVGPLGQAWLASAPRAPGREPTGGFAMAA